jgi:hypothetical protein
LLRFAARSGSLSFVEWHRIILGYASREKRCHPTCFQVFQLGYGRHAKGDDDGDEGSDSEGEKPTASGSASAYDSLLWQFVQDKQSGKDEADTYFGSLYEFKNARALYFKLVQHCIFESYADWVGEHCKFTDIPQTG